VIKTEDSKGRSLDGYETQYEKDGTYVYTFSPDTLHILDGLFEKRYWPYSSTVVEPKVKAAAKAAFKEAWGYFERSFRFRISKLERKHDGLTICHNCKGPRFFDQPCPADTPGCDI